MSYCRWSSDGYRCDVYAYEHVDGYFSVNVAGRKRVFPDDFPTDPWMDFFAQKIDSETFTKRYREYHDLMDALPFQDLTIPSVGKCFEEPDLESFLARMKALKDEGAHIPDGVIEGIEEELAEENTLGTLGETPEQIKAEKL